MYNQLLGNSQVPRLFYNDKGVFLDKLPNIQLKSPFFSLVRYLPLDTRVDFGYGNLALGFRSYNKLFKLILTMSVNHFYSDHASHQPTLHTSMEELKVDEMLLHIFEKTMPFRCKRRMMSPIVTRYMKTSRDCYEYMSYFLAISLLDYSRNTSKKANILRRLSPYKNNFNAPVGQEWKENKNSLVSFILCDCPIILTWIMRHLISKILSMPQSSYLLHRFESIYKLSFHNVNIHISGNKSSHNHVSQPKESFVKEFLHSDSFTRVQNIIKDTKLSLSEIRHELKLIEQKGKDESSPAKASTDQSIITIGNTRIV